MTGRFHDLSASGVFTTGALGKKFKLDKKPSEASSRWKPLPDKWKFTVTPWRKSHRNYFIQNCDKEEPYGLTDYYLETISGTHVAKLTVDGTTTCAAVLQITRGEQIKIKLICSKNKRCSTLVDQIKRYMYDPKVRATRVVLDAAFYFLVPFYAALGFRVDDFRTWPDMSCVPNASGRFNWEYAGGDVCSDADKEIVYTDLKNYERALCSTAGTRGTTTVENGEGVRIGPGLDRGTTWAGWARIAQEFYNVEGGIPMTWDPSVARGSYGADLTPPTDLRKHGDQANVKMLALTAAGDRVVEDMNTRDVRVVPRNPDGGFGRRSARNRTDTFAGFTTHRI